MKTVQTIVRLALGVLIAFSGLNKFGEWLNASFMHDAMQFIINLVDIGGGFIIYSIAILEIIIGIALISNKFSVLAAFILFPLMVSILIFHITLDLNGIVIALLVFAMNVYLLLSYREKLSNIVKPA